MSRLRGEKVTDTDRRMFERMRWPYHFDDHHIPRRIHKRLRMAYDEITDALDRDPKWRMAMPGRFLVHGGVYEQLSPAVLVALTQPPVSP